MRRTLLFTTVPDTRVARSADAFLVAFVIAVKMAALAFGARGVKDLVFVAVFDLLACLPH